MIGIFKIVANKDNSFNSNDELKRRIKKATYSNDTNRPKLKHVNFILDCLKGNIIDVVPENCFDQFFQNYKENLHNWVHTMKSFLIFHFGMQDIESFPIICKSLVPRIPVMSSFIKPLPISSKEDYSIHTEAVSAYYEYVKKMAQHVIINFITFLDMKDLPLYFKNTPIEKIIENFYQVKEMLLSALNISKFFSLAKNFKIYKQMVIQLFIDINKFYYICVETLKYFYSIRKKLNDDFPSKVLLMIMELNKISPYASYVFKSSLSYMKSSIQVPTIFIVNEDMINEFKSYINFSESERLETNSNEECQIASNNGNIFQQNQADSFINQRQSTCINKGSNPKKADSEELSKKSKEYENLKDLFSLDFFKSIGKNSSEKNLFEPFLESNNKIINKIVKKPKANIEKKSLLFNEEN